MALPRKVRNLIGEYQEFQNRLPLRQAEPALHDLVRFNGNKGMPIHGWFLFKEGFSAGLLPWLCQTIPYRLDDIENILDPFCGAGTSLLSAQLAYRGSKGMQAYGIEHNPFVRFVAQAKLAWPHYRLDRVEELIPKFTAHRLSERRTDIEVPRLSTIQNPRVFAPSVVRELLAIRDRMCAELCGQPEESFFLLGWAAVIERVSGVRKDGRALRFKDKDSIPPIREALRDQWIAMLCDLKKLEQEDVQPTNVKCSVLAGDGRTLVIPELGGKVFDLIIYSPPYLNNIDYSEVYKLELWMSGHVSTQEEFRALRLGSFRSHPSVKFPDTNLIDKLPKHSWPWRLRQALLEALPEDDDRAWRIRLIRGYMDDMYQALSAQFRFARPDAPVVCVIGNSLHGRRDHPIPVATDLLICALAKSVGFEVKRLQVARQLRRRDHSNELLRESIILMRRP